MQLCTRCRSNSIVSYCLHSQQILRRTMRLNTPYPCIQRGIYSVGECAADPLTSPAFNTQLLSLSPALFYLSVFAFKGIVVLCVVSADTLMCT